MVLSLIGHPKEGAAEFDRVIELARASQQLLPLWASHGFYVFCCEVTGEAASALAHAREAVDYAEKSGSNQGRIVSYFNLGIAHLLNCAWQEALEPVQHAWAIGRERQLRSTEGRVLSALAATHLGLGDPGKALALAEEAIAVSRRRGTRMWEFSALLTRIRALREIQGVHATRDIEAALSEADAWLQMSGAKRHEPFLHVERAEPGSPNR